MVSREPPRIKRTRGPRGLLTLHSFHCSFSFLCLARTYFHNRSLEFLRLSTTTTMDSPTSLNQLAYHMRRMSTNDWHSASFPSPSETLSLSAHIRAEAEHRELQECGQFNCLGFKMTPSLDSSSYISTASSLSRGSGMTRSQCVTDLSAFGASHYDSSRPMESKTSFGPGPNHNEEWGYYVDAKK